MAIAFAKNVQPTWIDGQWLLLRNDLWVGDRPYNRPAEPWPDGFDVATLPTPKYEVGQKVDFKYCGGFKTGVIQRIWMRPDDWNAGTFHREVHYEILWTGHRMWSEECDVRA